MALPPLRRAPRCCRCCCCWCAEGGGSRDSAAARPAPPRVSPAAAATRDRPSPWQPAGAALRPGTAAGREGSDGSEGREREKGARPAPRPHTKSRSPRQRGAAAGPRGGAARAARRAPLGAGTHKAVPPPHRLSPHPWAAQKRRLARGHRAVPLPTAAWDRRVCARLVRDRPPMPHHHPPPPVPQHRPPFFSPRQGAIGLRRLPWKEPPRRAAGLRSAEPQQGTPPSSAPHRGCAAGCGHPHRTKPARTGCGSQEARRGLGLSYGKRFIFKECINIK